MGLSSQRVSEQLLGDTYEALRRAKALGSLREEMAKFTRRMGFDRFAYALRVTGPSLPAKDYALTDYPFAWGERYLAHGYFAIDPIVEHCARSALPALWDDEALHAVRTWPFWEEARSFGLRSGLSLAIYAGPAALGIFSLCRDQRLDFEAEDLARLVGRVQVFVTLLQQSISRIGAPVMPQWPTRPLTARELECLRWTAAGKTAWEIGCILGISQRTVGFHMASVLLKLGARNKMQAAARALALELLS